MATLLRKLAPTVHTAGQVQTSNTSELQVLPPAQALPNPNHEAEALVAQAPVMATPTMDLTVRRRTRPTHTHPNLTQMHNFTGEADILHPPRNCSTTPPPPIAEMDATFQQQPSTFEFCSSSNFSENNPPEYVPTARHLCPSIQVAQEETHQEQEHYNPSQQEKEGGEQHFYLENDQEDYDKGNDPYAVNPEDAAAFLRLGITPESIFYWPESAEFYEDTVEFAGNHYYDTKEVQYLQHGGKEAYKPLRYIPTVSHLLGDSAFIIPKPPQEENKTALFKSLSTVLNTFNYRTLGL